MEPVADTTAPRPDPSMRQALERLGVLRIGEPAEFVPLVGGVSSDIWRVDAGQRRFCVKRALAKLKVAADWRAPIERSRYEAAWFRTAGAIVPDAVPRLLADDAQAGLFAMEWLDPAEYRLWKSELRDGRANPADAAAVGIALAKIHAGTAGNADIAAAFPTDAIFCAIRLEPYLVATGRAHRDLASRLEALVATTAATKRALVHGDVSPKNILLGPHGPVFLDAECAWYGDPAFDIAFCLNHLLLKCLWTPAARPAFLRCFDALAQSWLGGVDWEPRDGIERRAAHLLPALLLARVDGKSPVEYVQSEADKAHVRRVGRALLQRPVDALAEVRQSWSEEIGQ
jgi:aminoglycoside phosphotransferase (APT) family kinase protein